jgi:putative phage-type endonuclease
MTERLTHQITGRQQWLEMRKRNVSASDMAAIFGCSPYKTALQLWGEKTGRLPAEDIDNDVLRRGRIFEPAVAEGLGEAHPEWAITKAVEYCELPEHRIGATPDFYAHDGAPFLIQAKTVTPSVYEREWTPAPPAHYLIQVQTELLVTGAKRSLLAPMVLDGYKFPIHEYLFEADADFQGEILKASAVFWECVDEDREPKIKLSQDGPTLAMLHPDGQPEPVLALHGDADFVAACRDHNELGKQIKALEERRAERSTAIMGRLRNHAKAEAQEFRVNWTTCAETTVAAHVKKSYRRLTVGRIKGVD